MNKLYTLLFLMFIIIFSGCEANYDDTNTTQLVVSEANVTINDIGNIDNKTNDKTPAFSGKFYDINQNLGISLSVGGATYKIWPQSPENWELDTELPNVTNSSNIDISRQTSGPIPLSLADGEHTIVLTAQDSNGTEFTFEKTFIVDTTSDVTITDINITKTPDAKPKINGKSTNISGTIELKFIDRDDENNSKTYTITPFENGDWSLDTASASGTIQNDFKLIENNLYYIDIKAKDKDSNYIEPIRMEYTPGSFRLIYAYYNNFATNSTNDDMAYIYFNRRFAPSSLSAVVDTYNVYNQGEIGSNSGIGYNMSYFTAYMIYMNNGGTQSQEFNKSTQLSLKKSGITDYYGIEPDDDNPKVQVQYLDTFALLNTFSKQCVIDDGNSSIIISCDDLNNTLLKNDAYYNFKDLNKTDTNYNTLLINRSFVSNNDIREHNASDFNASRNLSVLNSDNNIHWATNNEAVLDVQTHLIWQIGENNSTKTYADAVSYCDQLTLSGISNWRLPSIKEMASIINRNTSQVYGGILNANYGQYWSSNSLANSTTKQWVFNLGTGQNYITEKTNLRYTKCVYER